MALPITRITTHEADALARLPGWLQDSVNYQAFLTLLVEPYQAIEDVLIDLLDGHSIDTAVGVQLDVIGKILDMARVSVGESDADYRIRLYGRSAELSRSGEPETLISTWLIIWTAVKIYYTDVLGNATFELTAEVVTDPGDSEQDAAALEAISTAKGGGIGAVLQVVESIPFLWGDSADADANGDLPVDEDHGFGDSADADGNGDITAGAGQGGNFARVL